MLVAMSGTTQTSSTPAGPAGVEETIKDFWASRPRRPRDGRKIAGVAAGIGRRYGIDPVVVRVALVTATIFGGIGLPVYLLGWLFLPEENDQVSAFESLIGRGESSVSKQFTLVLCIGLLPTLSWAFGGAWFNGGGFIGLGLLIAALYLLHRNRGHLNRPVEPVAMHSGTGAGTAVYGAASNPFAAYASAKTERPDTPPAWDPLGAAPLAWDLPDPAPAPAPQPPAPPQRPRKKSGIGLATFGVAIAVAGVGSALAATGAPWFTAGHVVGLVLGVLGLGMVAGSFLGGGRGLIGLAVPLGIAGFVLTAVPFGQFDGGFGDIHEIPRTAAQLEPVYEHSGGQIDLDLTQLNSDTPVRTTVSNGAGDTRVLVPHDADVTFRCENGVGSTDCLDISRDGFGGHDVSGVSYGDDGIGGLKLDIEIKQGAGNVELVRE
jgi:phage shock protein PspC (stress-responsive transcriptional regulator)